MKPRRIGAFAIVVLALSGTVSGQGVGASAFFANRTAEDTAALDRGELLVDRLADWRKMGLGAQGDAAEALRSQIAKLKPNYAIEIMAATKSDDGTLDRLRAALSDVKGYVSIVYLSPKYNATFPLFDTMTIKSRVVTPGGEAIDSTQHMQPFEDFDAHYQYVSSGDELVFSSSNTSTLKYFGYSAVPVGNMIWSIYARRIGNKFYFYGIGAMRVFDFFGAARDRLEPSFMGRVESFMRYMYGKTQ